MATVLLLAFLVFAGVSSGSYIRYRRDIPSGASSGSGSGAFSSASSFSSSSGTKVNPGPGGSGNFNAFSGSGNFGNPPFGGGVGSGGGAGGFSGGGGFNGGGGYSGGGGFGNGGGFGGQSPFGYGFNPFVPQFGQQYPYTPFAAVPPQFDFVSFLNQYFQALQNFNAQAQQAEAANANKGGVGMYSPDSNEVGGNAFATYSPQGGYGSASVYPAPVGGLETRFGESGDSGTPQNSVGPVSSVSGNFKPPGGSSFGVFTSSSSGSSDVNGKKTNFKQSSIGINDNGKVTTYTSHDP